MLSDDKILEKAAKCINQFIRVAEARWRPTQVDENYALVEGAQWVQKEYDKVIADGLKPYTLNYVAPVIDAVAGFQVQNRSEVTYLPRMIGEEKERKRKYAEMADNGVNWIEKNARVAFYDSQAFRDSLICGVGATDTLIDYLHNPWGEAAKERIFPGNVMWDTAAREKNLRDRDWCAKARIVNAERLMEEEGDEEERGDAGATMASSTFEDSYFLKYYDTIQTAENLAVVYDFQWREKKPVCMVRNPFLEHLDDDLIMNWLAEAQTRLKFDPAAGVIAVKKEHYGDFKKELDALGVKFEKIDTQKRYCYYRAEIWGNKVRSKSENYTQSGFSIKFITGKYSETDQCWYGLAHPMKDPQRLLNQAIVDLQGYLDSIPKGGVNIEAGAVDNIKAFIQTYGKARDVTVFAKDALKDNRVQPKTPAPFPPGLIEALNLYADSIMRVTGVTADFMGLNDSKEMTALLQGQLVRQGLTVLSPYFDAMKFYIQDNGPMYIDVLRILAENNPGRPIRNVLGAAEDEDYLPLLLDDIAAEYDVEVQDAPLSPAEKQETFKYLMDMAGVMMPINPQLGNALASQALEYSPLKQKQVDDVVKAATPQPQQPDPLSQALVQAETEYKIAQAKKNTADAHKSIIEAAAIVTEKLGGVNPDTGQPGVIDQVPADPVAMRELDDKKAAEDRKYAQEVDKGALEAARQAAEDERKERELEMKERELAIKERELELKRKDGDEGRKLERHKMRVSNPDAAASLDLLEQKKEQNEREFEKRMKLMEKTSEETQKQSAAALKAVADTGGKQTGEIAKALAKQGAALQAIAQGQKVIASQVTGVGESVVRVTDALERMNRPRRKVIKLKENAQGELDEAIVEETAA